MLFNIPGVKDVVIKNMTGEELKNIYLTFEGLEKHPLKISSIRKDGQETKSLYLTLLSKKTELILSYYIGEVKEEIVVYDNLCKEDLRTLILTISKKDDKLQVETIIDEEHI